jgi:hypothetical protein
VEIPIYRRTVMSESFVIQWKSIVNGRVGKGTKIFSREEGEALIRELNNEYPEMVHELVIAPPIPGHSGAERTMTPESKVPSPLAEEEVTAPIPPLPASSHAFPE